MKKIVLLFIVICAFKISVIAQNSSVFITNTKYNILYAGIENNLDIISNAIKTDDFIITLSDSACKFYKKSTTSYILIPVKAGQLTISVSILENGRKTLLESKLFHVKTLPAPDVQIKNRQSGTVERDFFSNAVIDVIQNNSNPDIKFEVVSFTISSIVKGFVEEIKSSSNKITDEQLKLINQTHYSRKIYFDDIIVKDQKGKKFRTSSLMFKIGAITPYIFNKTEENVLTFEAIQKMTSIKLFENTGQTENNQDSSTIKNWKVKSFIAEGFSNNKYFKFISKSDEFSPEMKSFFKTLFPGDVITINEIIIKNQITGKEEFLNSMKITVAIPYILNLKFLKPDIEIDRKTLLKTKHINFLFQQNKTSEVLFFVTTAINSDYENLLIENWRKSNLDSLFNDEFELKNEKLVINNQKSVLINYTSDNKYLSKDMITWLKKEKSGKIILFKVFLKNNDGTDNEVKIAVKLL